MEQPPDGYVRVEVVTTAIPGGTIPPRPVHWPPPPDQAATLADWMAPELLEAWQVVARDLQTPDAIIPSVVPPDDRSADDPESYGSAEVYWPDNRGAGISVPRHQPLADRVVYLADQFQDHEVEALWQAGRSAVWPHCPRHPGTHPLRAWLHDGVAVWRCGETDVVAAIGELLNGR